MIDEYEHIKFLADTIADSLHPQKIYLFGSFAEGRNTDGSDYDFYVVMPDDDHRNTIDLIVSAQKSLRHKKQRAVDVLVNSLGNFNLLKNSPLTVENDVATKGVLIYG